MSIHHTVHENNPMPVRSVGNTTSHGTEPIDRLTPYVAGSSVYNFMPSNFRTYTAGDGSAAVEDRQFKVSSGTSLGTYGTIQSFRSVNYRTGGTAVLRFSARFGTPLALTWSGAGGFTIGDELSFGYNGTDFGVWHRKGGKAEVRTLTITDAATGNETLTVTVNDTAYAVEVTSGTVQHNAKE